MLAEEEEEGHGEAEEEVVEEREGNCRTITPTTSWQPRPGLRNLSSSLIPR